MTSICGERNQRICTLVFMDLEATGLPSYVGKRNVHITEMSFIAIDRESFETDSTQRVMNKLSLCVRPRSAVSFGAMQVTGLYNDVLEKQQKFDDSIPKLLEYFFRRLQKPICLLAHNGKKYDFPLLQAELKNINYVLDPQILCADTLEAIRFIILNPAPEITEEEKVPSQSKDGDLDIDTLLSQDMELFKYIKEPCNQQTEPIQTETTPGKSNIDQHFRTPPNPSSANVPNPTFTTNFHKRIKLDSTSHMRTPDASSLKPRPCPTHVRRKLFPAKNGENGKSIVSKPTQFSLEKLYLSFFGEKPIQSHYAEADCIALSKVCQKVNHEFLKWIDGNSQSFCETKAMW